MDDIKLVLEDLSFWEKNLSFKRVCVCVCSIYIEQKYIDPGIKWKTEFN